MAAEYTDRFITVDGCRLHYLDWGNAGAPPLLFVHGLTQQAHTFDAVARRFRERFHCVAPDVRGRGESAWAAPESYNYGQYVKDVLALLDALGVEATDYVGTSMGGLIAITIARSAARRLLRVVLNDIGPEIGAAGLERIAKSVASRAAGSYRSLDDYIDNALLPQFYFLKGRPREQLREWVRWGLKQQADGSWASRYDPAIQGATKDDPASRAARDAFLWEGFRAFKSPLLLIRGAESDLLLPGTVQKMRAAQPGLQVAEVPGASHAPMLDEPEAVAALEAFLA
jgi:pimeloyl-ACP methyl ester carboxylesterase